MSDCSYGENVLQLLAILYLFNLPPGGVQSIVIGVTVCMSAYISQKPSDLSLIMKFYVVYIFYIAVD